MIVIGYVRVSTREQAESGLSLDWQRATIQAEADRRGWQVQWVEDAGFSAKSLRRPGVERALKMLAAGEAEALVVAKLDRLSRSVMDFSAALQTAQRQRWAVVALDLGVDTSTPTGELVAGVMMQVAQWERRIISERTSNAMGAARARGVRFGGPISTPAAVRERVVALAATGLSHAAVARALTAEGHSTASGGTWHRSGVRRVLASHALDLAAAERRGTPHDSTTPTEEAA